MKTKLFIYLTGMLFLQACALQLDTLDPEPALRLTKQDKTLALVIDDKVENDFFIPAYGGIKKSKVRQWHKSLTNAFVNGFREYFRPVAAKDKPEYILQLEQTALKLIPSNVSGYRNITVLDVELKFQASLLNSRGEKLRKIEGIAKPERSMSSV